MLGEIIYFLLHFSTPKFEGGEAIIYKQIYLSLGLYVVMILDVNG
jgi:hypothetical protein